MSEVDDLDRVARDVNLMLDEIWRLLDQLRHIGDDIATTCARRSPSRAPRSSAARARLDDRRIARGDGGGARSSRRSAATISAFLRVSAMESAGASAASAGRPFGDLRRPVRVLRAAGAEQRRRHRHRGARPTLVRGDEDLLREAISNLVDNAIKFTPKGGRVLIAAEAADGRATVAVSDSGCGVPPQDREDIFRRFYRGARDGAAPDTAGLSIVAAVAKLHGFR